MKSIFKVLAGLLVASSLLAMGAYAQTIDAIQKRGKIVIGMDQTIPPYGLLDEKREPAGYDADVARAIGKALGVQVEFVQVAGPTRIPALLTNQVDIVVATLGMSPERANQVWFSMPYGSVDVVFVSKAANKFMKPGDTVGKRIGVVRGGIQDSSFTPLAPGARQGSCRLIHAARGCLSVQSECVLVIESRSGLSVTTPMGDQLRVLPDQRAGWSSRQRVYRSCRAARIA